MQRNLLDLNKVIIFQTQALYKSSIASCIFKAQSKLTRKILKISPCTKKISFALIRHWTPRVLTDCAQRFRRILEVSRKEYKSNFTTHKSCPKERNTKKKVDLRNRKICRLYNSCIPETNSPMRKKQHSIILFCTHQTLSLENFRKFSNIFLQRFRNFNHTSSPALVRFHRKNATLKRKNGRPQVQDTALSCFLFA